MNQHMKGQKQLLAFLSTSLALQMLPGSVLQVLASDHGDDVQKQKDHAQTLDDTTYEAVREYWRTELLGDTEGLSEDGNLQTVIEQLDAKAQHYLDTMLPTSGDHLWDDQAYNDAEMGAKATETLDRLKMIAIQINEPMSSLYQDETAKAKVLEGLRFVLDKKYGPDTVKGSSNWWDWEIGAPKAMVDIAILLYDDLDAETIADVTATIDRFVPKADYRLNSSLKETGANLIDKVAIVIKRAALDGNEERLAHAKECMAPLFAYSSSGDGYYPDGSFIQHGNIPYNGSYGYVLLNELTNCIIMLSYTDYAIDEEDIQFYENTLLNHYLPFLSYGGNMVDSVRGRAVSRKAQQGDTMGMQTMGVLLQYADTAASEETKEAIYSSLKPIAEQKFADEEQSEDFSLLAYADYIRVKNLAQAEDVSEAMERNTYDVYYNMDRIVAQREDFTFTVAANSSRMVTEQGNSENILGRYQGQGYTQIYNDDINQYNEDYNATVDPMRLTGVTTAHQKLGFTAAGQSAFSGGTSLDGINGVSGFELTGNKNLTELNGGFGSESATGVKSGISAKKSYFVFGNKIVYLGSDITNNNTDTSVDYVESIVENRKTFDGMTLTVDGNEKVSENGTETITDPDTAYLSGKTAESGIGYVFLEDGLTLDVKKEMRSGTWNDVNKLAKFTDYTPVQNDFISMAVNHGNDPEADTYAWVTLANVSEEELAAYTAAPTIEVLVNEENVQGVYDSESGQNAFNFFAAGSAQLESGETVTVSGPASIIVAKGEHGYEIAVSDPTQANGSVDVTIDGMADLTNIGVSQGNASVVSSDADSMTVRVSFPERGATENVRIGVVYATTSENLALNKETQASSVVQNSATNQRLAKFAVDGDPATRWAANYERTNASISVEEADEQWIALDLGEEMTFNEIRVLWQESLTNDYDIQISNDTTHADDWSQKEWTTIHNVLEDSGYKAGDRTDTIVLDSDVSARYIRIKGNPGGRPKQNGEGAGGLSIYELEVYSSLDLERSVEKAEELLANYDSPEAFATPQQYETLRAALEGVLEDARTLMDKGNAFTQEELREVTIALEEASAQYDAAVLHVERVTISGPDDLTLDRGESVQLEAVVAPVNAYRKDVTWSSSDTGVARVDENGMVTGVSSGTVTITARSKDSGVSDSIEVQVVVRPTSITLDKEELTMTKGDTSVLNASVAPMLAGTDTLVWMSTNSDVVTVQDGQLQAVGVGEADIIVFSDAYEQPSESPSAICHVTVEADWIVPSTENLALLEGTTATATSTVSASGVTPQGAIDGDTATRWASDYKQISTEEAEKQALTVEFKEPQTFNHIDITWYSDTVYGKEYQILVSMDGEHWEEAYHETNGQNGTYGFDFDEVTAKYVRFQGIKRTATNGGYGIVEFAIYDHLNGNALIAQARELIDLYPGDLTGDEAGCQALEADIAAIEDLIENDPQYTQEELRPLLEDLQAAIRAYEEKIVKVTGIEGSTMTLKEGEQAKAGYTITPADATNKEVTFTNQDPKIVSVDEDGTITALRKGTAVITVTSVDGGHQADITVTVRTDTPPSILASDLTVEVGSEFDPLAYVSAVDEEDGTLTLTADNVIENTVSTDREGEGIVTYQVTDSDGHTVTRTIHVTVRENAEVRAARDALKGAIDAAQRLDASGYTKDSYEKLAEALRQAESVAADPLATKDQLQAAQTQLQQAIDGLEARPSGGEDVTTPDDPQGGSGSDPKEEADATADTGAKQDTGAAAFFTLLSAAGIAEALRRRRKSRS